jgi:pyruvate dehydrogenase E1 component alpha subunit
MEVVTHANDGPPEDLSRDVLMDLFGKMSLIKLCDERFRQAMRAGRIIAPYYPPRGQEAIAAAVGANLNREDYLITIYRGLHDQLAKGMPLKQLWAEYAGRMDGACKGKGGPMHITHPESGVMVTTGVVGSSMPIANGLALASQISGDGRVTVALFGDGAANIGAFHEALNLASIWKLPVIFVCSNNLYGEHSKFENMTAVDHIADRATAYRMPGFRVDGNDPAAVFDVAREAVRKARAGDGPTLIEAMTFRFCGHVFGDNDSYMDEGEKAAAMERDPVPAFRQRLIVEAIADEAELAAIEADIERRIDEAQEFALASPFPDIGELNTDILGVAA